MTRAATVRRPLRSMPPDQALSSPETMTCAGTARPPPRRGRAARRRMRHPKVMLVATARPWLHSTWPTSRRKLGQCSSLSIYKFTLKQTSLISTAGTYLHSHFRWRFSAALTCGKSTKRHTCVVMSHHCAKPQESCRVMSGNVQRQVGRAATWPILLDGKDSCARSAPMITLSVSVKWRRALHFKPLAYAVWHWHV